jgi:hypothetical protein
MDTDHSHWLRISKDERNKRQREVSSLQSVLQSLPLPVARECSKIVTSQCIPRDITCNVQQINGRASVETVARDGNRQILCCDLCLGGWRSLALYRSRPRHATHVMSQLHRYWQATTKLGQIFRLPVACSFDASCRGLLKKSADLTSKLRPALPPYRA